jgi:hypothetical protein
MKAVLRRALGGVSRHPPPPGPFLQHSSPFFSILIFVLPTPGGHELHRHLDELRVFLRVCRLRSVIRQHTSAYVSIRQRSIRQHTSAYVSIRQHTSAYIRIGQHTCSRGALDGRKSGRPPIGCSDPIYIYIYMNIHIYI